MKEKILLVEDEVTMAMIISETLRDQGFNVICAHDGLEGMKKFEFEDPALIIADVMMPQMTGFQMVKLIRKQNKKIPILFLTARSDIRDLENGFQLGCNDYLKKPFQMKELVIRLKALLGCLTTTTSEKKRYAIGNYLFDAETQQLYYKAKCFDLSYLENQILKSLCDNQNHVITAEQIIADLWEENDFYTHNRLHGFIHKLRKFLSPDPSLKILNIRGIGYKLVVLDNTLNGY